MLQIGVLFFTALVTSTAAAPPQVNTSDIIVYLDITGCVNLLCEIEEFNLTPPTKPYSQVMVGSFRGNESEAELLKRKELKYPFNTFTIMKYPDSYEVSKKYVLLCNAAMGIYHEQFLDLLNDPEAPFKPKFVCSDKDKNIFDAMMGK